MTFAHAAVPASHVRHLSRHDRSGSPPPGLPSPPPETSPPPFYYLRPPKPGSCYPAEHLECFLSAHISITDPVITNASACLLSNLLSNLAVTSEDNLPWFSVVERTYLRLSRPEIPYGFSNTCSILRQQRSCNSRALSIWNIPLSPQSAKLQIGNKEVCGEGDKDSLDFQKVLSTYKTLEVHRF